MGATSVEDCRIVRLPDGRDLAFSEYGAAAGRPLLYFHGHPSSRLEGRFLDEDARALGVRVLAIDRPGMGRSTHLPRRTIGQWPADVNQLVDHLGLGRFAVVGFSGGAPYALACARAFPERVTACGVVSGVGRSSPAVVFLSSWLPYLVLPLTRRMFQGEARAMASLRRATARMPAADQAALSTGNHLQWMALALDEALRQGSRGAALDGRLIARPWSDFAPSDVRGTRLFLWHGSSDAEVALALARETARALPDCRARFFEGEAHLSVLIGHGREIVDVLTAAPVATSVEGRAY